MMNHGADADAGADNDDDADGVGDCCEGVADVSDGEAAAKALFNAMVAAWQVHSCPACAEVRAGAGVRSHTARQVDVFCTGM